MLGDNLPEEQMSVLFRKIDANSDGTVDWDEFSGYMISVSGESEDFRDIILEKHTKLISTSHKDLIIRVDYSAKERKFTTVSRDGLICIWNSAMKLHRVINTQEFNSNHSWVADAKLISEHNKIILVTDDRQYEQLTQIVNLRYLCHKAEAYIDDQTARF